MKCNWCGAEFEPRDHQRYCSLKCRYEHDNTFNSASKALKNLARRFGFTITENKNKIINAKLMLFKKAYMQCPCDAHNKNRFCGSPKCVEEVNRTGKCHCGLFVKEITKSE